MRISELSATAKLISSSKSWIGRRSTTWFCTCRIKRCSYWNSRCL